MSEGAESTGKSVAGYELLGQIGRGGMGTVHRARAPSGEIVALKLLDQRVTENARQLQRFQREARTACRLHHPNIVQAYDFGADGRQHYIAMEYVEGEDLAELLKRRGRLPESEALRIIGPIAQALHKAHARGLIHRDVKPGNILLGRDGSVKLTDMGLVKEIDTDANLTQTGSGLGTHQYMAPEQFKHAKNVDIRCDVYSLAATLYVMVTGKLPFEGANPVDSLIRKARNQTIAPKQRNPDLSNRISRAILAALDADRANRPKDMRAFLRSLGFKVGPSRSEKRRAQSSSEPVAPKPDARADGPKEQDAAPETSSASVALRWGGWWIVGIVVGVIVALLGLAWLLF